VQGLKQNLGDSNEPQEAVVVFVNRAMDDGNFGGVMAEGLGVMVDEIYDPVDSERRSRDLPEEPLLRTVLPPDASDGDEPPLTRLVAIDPNAPSKLRLSGRRMCGCQQWVFILIVVLVVVVGALIIGIVGSINDTVTRTQNWDPSIAEADIRTIVAYINNETLSGQTLVYPPNETSSTPENLALQWLIENVTVQFTFVFELNKFAILEAYALLTLYASTGGSSWTYASGWQDGLFSECQWYGVICTDKFLAAYNATHSVVTSIALPTNNLHGSLSSDLGLLIHLESFRVGNNSLTGTLPATIGQWSQLLDFDASLNSGLTGTLPAVIGRWSLILDFDVSLNSGLTGTIPDSIAYWTVIDTLSVQETGLKGTIPEKVCKVVNSAFVDCIVACICCTKFCG
jgi:hypothetical protein